MARAAWRPTSGVHLAIVEDDLVVLDLGSDRYLCLRAAGSVVARCGSGFWRIHPDLAKALHEASLIERARTADPIERGAEPPPRATASAVPDLSAPLHMSDAPEMLGRLMDLLLAYRGRSMAQLLTVVRRSRARAGREGGVPLETVVDRFHRWLPYAPAPTKCLVRSFMLLRLLHRHGHDAAWVFGVTTWPFRAHCWLQSGDTVLDDDHEHVAGFVPIMVV